MLKLILCLISVIMILSQDSTIKHEMVFIKGGSFKMGQSDGEGDERPVHTVKLSDFYMGKYEVTVAQYRQFINATSGKMPKKPESGWIDNHPIYNISWNDAEAYIKWLNKETGLNYRLPTEAEFDFVIRNGGKPGVYPFKNNRVGENVADIEHGKATGRTNIWTNYNDGYAFASPVGSFPANELGVHDINGNVWEWVKDWYSHFTESDKINPQGAPTGKHKVGKGASFDSDPQHTRSASRAFVLPTFKRPGFRLAFDTTK